MSSSSSGAELDSSATEANAFAPQWKQEANHRLAAHRARRGSRTGLQAAFPGMEERGEPEDRESQPKTRSVADRVAARYAKAPTYSEMLAAEARNAARAAEAAAVAAGEAHAAAQAILVGLDVDIHDLRDEELRDEELRNDDRREQFLHAPAEPVAQTPAPAHRRPDTANHSRESRPGTSQLRPAILEVSEEEGGEIELEDEPFAPIQPLPAKLLEFPRELVAPRKARPRLAEGPLREEYDRGDERSQLRIFEVEPEAISTTPVVEPVLPEWSAIRLDAPADPHGYPQRGSRSEGRASHPDEAVAEHPGSHADFDLPLQTAPLEDRLMAGIVDAALVAAGFLVFVFVFAACTVHPPVGKPAWIGAAGAFSAFAVIYQLLFFNFGVDTPGMRYAKIALCTFDDENPTRRAMRRRLGALLLSASPIGLGILWAFFDDDRLGWHDRISRTYQRSYR